MKSFRKNLLKFLLAAFLLALPTSIVAANSLPPPFRLWFSFVNSNGRTVEIDSLQLVGCTDVGCGAPLFLKGYGICSAPECFKVEPSLSDKWKLDCAGNRCLLETKFKGEDALPPYLKMVITAKDATWVSDVAPNPDCNYCDSGYQVVLGEKTAAVLPEAEFTETGNINKNSFAAYLISVGIELVVSGLILGIWKKKWTLTIKKGVLTAFFANILSFPITWLLIPSFGFFQLDSSRKAGFIAAIAAVILLLMALWINNNRGKIKKWMIITGIISIPVCVVIFAVGLLLSTYGNHMIYASGLPPAAVIALAETFAVLFEALIFYLFCKNDISLKQAMVLSVATNVVSFGVSLLLF